MSFLTLLHSVQLLQKAVYLQQTFSIHELSVATQSGGTDQFTTLI